MKGSYRLNEEVAVTGKAIAYAGNNIDGAKVATGWCGKCVSLGCLGGTGVTSRNGARRWKSPMAKPPRMPRASLKSSLLPYPTAVFPNKTGVRYTVYADVTDITGETQSGETNVNVGYISMRADVTANAISLDKAQINLDSLRKFKISTTNLSGQFEPTKGALKLELLKAPSQTYLIRYWEKPDRHTMTEAEFKKAFPQFAYGNEDEQQNWPVERSIFSENWDTEKSKEVILPKVKLNAGWYLLTLTTQDKFGEKIEVKNIQRL